MVEQNSGVLGRDGCLNFFAGPADNQFSAKGAEDERFIGLADILDANMGLWCPKAEE